MISCIKPVNIAKRIKDIKLKPTEIYRSFGNQHKRVYVMVEVILNVSPRIKINSRDGLLVKESTNDFKGGEKGSIFRKISGKSDNSIGKFWHFVSDSSTIQADVVPTEKPFGKILWRSWFTTVSTEAIALFIWEGMRFPRPVTLLPIWETVSGISCGMVVSGIFCGRPRPARFLSNLGDR